MLIRQLLGGFAIACLVLSPVVGLADDAAELQLAIDATDLPRKLLRSTVIIPVTEEVTQAGGEVLLRYPQWVPGAHAPGGPIANLAGLIIENDQQQTSRLAAVAERRLSAGRSRSPPAAGVWMVRLRYITNQPTTQSMGLDSFGSELLGIISPNTVLLYPAAADIDATSISVSLTLPVDWSAATALPIAADPAESSTRDYAAVSLRTLVDSPIMCGRYCRVYDLVEPSQQVVDTAPSFACVQRGGVGAEHQRRNYCSDSAGW